MNATPRFLYFDLGNVLLRFDHAIACRQMAAVAGVAPERVRAAVFDTDLEWRYERGDVSTDEFYEAFCTATGTRPDLAALLHAASDMFTLNYAIVPLVGHLHAAGYRLGILSNTCPAHWDFVSQDFANGGRFRLLDQCFGLHALSFRLRSMKPEPRIYSEAAALAGVRPEEIFFVDDREENVRGAREAGFDAVLFTTAAVLAEDLRARGLRFNY